MTTAKAGCYNRKAMTEVAAHEGDHHRSAALDGIRGLAILGVLVTHASHYFADPAAYGFRDSPLVFGWAGVDLFFGLSGFLITGILLKTRSAVNRGASFYARRVLRIAPIYYITLVVVLVAAMFVPWLNSVLPRPGWDRICYFFYLQNIPQLWGRNLYFYNILGHFWSLAVEEQFYLVWPLIVWTVPEKYLVRLSVFGISCSFALRYWVVSHNHIHIWWMYWTPTRGAEALLVGSLLAVFSKRFGRVRKSILSICAVAGVAILFGIALVHRVEFIDTDAGPYMYTIGYTGINLISFALIGFARHTVPVLTKVLRSGLLRVFGKYSYGIYVYHIPVYVVADHYLERWMGAAPNNFPLIWALALFVGLVGTSVSIALLSFRFVESPILSLKDRFAPVYGAKREEHVLAVAGSSVQ